MHRPLKHFPKDTSEAILGDLLSSCSCPPVAVIKARKSILGFCLGQGCSAMHAVSGHWGRVLGIPPQINPICLPSSSTSQVSCCPDDDGLLSLFRPPAPNRSHRPSGQRVCRIVGQALSLLRAGRGQASWGPGVGSQSN